jgi:hypothetical protein
MSRPPLSGSQPDKHGSEDYEYESNTGRVPDEIDDRDGQEDQAGECISESLLRHCVEPLSR